MASSDSISAFCSASPCRDEFETNVSIYASVNELEPNYNSMKKAGSSLFQNDQSLPIFYGGFLTSIELNLKPRRILEWNNWLMSSFRPKLTRLRYHVEISYSDPVAQI